MSNPEHLKERLAEAARYALLRRLAPALRHNMAGALQPISMMAAMLEKRLQKPDPDMVVLGKNSAALNTLSREASLSCMSLMAWLAPRDNEPVALDACLADAVGLVVTELSFRGLTLVNDTAGVQVEVPRSVVRNVFMATLIALTDLAAAPANVLLRAEQTADEVLVSIVLVPTQGETMPGAMTTYRDLHWDDVQALADTEAVSLAHTDLRAELRYRLA